MPAKLLQGMWLNGYVREMIEERDSGLNGNGKVNWNGKLNGTIGHLGAAGGASTGMSNGGARGGLTSRELSGEMGGDTVSV